MPASQLMAPAGFIREREITVWASVPSTAVFLEKMKMLQPGVFPSLRCTIMSGEPLPVRSAQAWLSCRPKQRGGQYLRTYRELCVQHPGQRLTDPPYVTANRGLVAIGKPMPGIEVVCSMKTAGHWRMASRANWRSLVDKLPKGTFRIQSAPLRDSR